MVLSIVILGCDSPINRVITQDVVSNGAKCFESVDTEGDSYIVSLDKACIDGLLIPETSDAVQTTQVVPEIATLEDVFNSVESESLYYANKIVSIKGKVKSAKKPYDSAKHNSIELVTNVPVADYYAWYINEYRDGPTLYQIGKEYDFLLVITGVHLDVNWQGGSNVIVHSTLISDENILEMPPRKIISGSLSAINGPLSPYAGRVVRTKGTVKEIVPESFIGTVRFDPYIVLEQGTERTKLKITSEDDIPGISVGKTYEFLVVAHSSNVVDRNLSTVSVDYISHN